MLSESLLATRTKNMGSSAIREILKVVAKPGIVSLAGGIPAPEAFPMQHINKLTQLVLEKYGSTALQYGTTEGFMPLREALVDYFKGLGITATAEEINITTGSQGVLDSLAKIFISPGDPLAVEAPTYLGAIQAFNPYEPNYVQMETDEDGLIPESMEEVIRKHHPKMVYLIPTFQNPTGRTIPVERRKKIAEIAKATDTLVIEDDPYGQLRYRGEFQTPIKVFAPDHVIYCGTFSKIFAPGLRLGFYQAPKFVREWLVKAKQGVDLHTSSLSQTLATEFLNGGYLENHLPNIIELYRPRQEAMLNAMDKFFPDSFTWSKPEGGMFIWAEGPKGMNILELYNEAIENHVAFVPGKYFYTEKGAGEETMRLNFTMADEETITAAIERLAQAMKKVVTR
ncbi:MAG: PLP-dependent aminotransferase family protein [Sediminispirochaetaceae bacterium]